MFYENNFEYIEFRRIQYRPGRSGDLEIADLVVVSVVQFVDWIRSSATLQQVLHLTNGQMTLLSGQSVEKPMPLANALGKFCLQHFDLKIFHAEIIQ